jgi:hypothetical protein
MNDKLIMPIQYSKFLFYSSFSMLISAIIAIIINDIYVTIYFFILFLTSINYWRRPEYGLRRNIDLFVVNCGIVIVFYQVCLLKNEFCRFVFFSMSICSAVFYIIENILEYNKNLQWIIFHMAIHLYVSLSALFVVFN